MTAREKNGTNGPPGADTGEEGRLTLDEAKRLVEEARKRGEDPGPIIKRLVVQVIGDVKSGLEG